MRLLFLCFFLCCQLFCNAQNESATKLLVQEISKGNAVGLSAAYAIDGQIIWQDAKGLANEAGKIPFNTATKCRTASIAKPMTAVAIMQLMEAGKINLDDKVSQYLNAFPHEQITVRQVLNHSSGIRAYQNKKEQNNFKNYPNLQSAAAIFLNDDLLFEPGTAFNYTSFGYTILGMLIEEISDLSFEQYLKLNVWDKVGMKNTGVEKIDVKVDGKAEIYHRNNKGKIKLVKQTDLSDRIPAGGIYSSSEDLVKFGMGILNGKLIKPETMVLMQENLGLKKEGNGYGLGWYLYGENPKLGNVFGHNGAQLGTSSWLMLLPDQNAVVCVVSNTSGALQETFGVTMGLFGIIADSKK